MWLSVPGPAGRHQDPWGTKPCPGALAGGAVLAAKAGPGWRSWRDRTGGLPGPRSAPAIRPAACLPAKPAADGSLRKQSSWLSRAGGEPGWEARRPLWGSRAGHRSLAGGPRSGSGQAPHPPNWHPPPGRHPVPHPPVGLVPSLGLSSSSGESVSPTRGPRGPPAAPLVCHPCTEIHMGV